MGFAHPFYWNIFVQEYRWQASFIWISVDEGSFAALVKCSSDYETIQAANVFFALSIVEMCQMMTDILEADDFHNL